jgi:TetR/AcrR family transcriptional regulator, transcriptional repressor for nem operon
METRNRILREAARLFALKGFHDTKVDALIQAAEVTSGAFFHHFRSKDDLAFAVIDHHMKERSRTLDQIEKGLPKPDDNDPLALVFRRLDAAREMIVRRRNRKGGCLIGNLSTTLSDTRPEFRRRLGECFDEMAAEFQSPLAETATHRGLAGQVDAWEIARYIVSVIEGAIMLSRTQRDIGLVQEQIMRLKNDIRQSFQAQEVMR